jgi:hypothetical protein
VKTLLAIAALVSGLSAYAQEESTTKAKQTDLSKGQNTQQQGDIDAEITNAKLRAESGSKSKHSVSSTLTYNGGNLEDAFGYNRPRLSAGAATPTLTNLQGDINYRYRMNANDSLTAGVGVQWLTPGHDLKAAERESGVSQQQASNPQVGYSRAFKGAGLQNILSATILKITDKEVINNEQTNLAFNLSHTGLYEIGTSGWQVGLSTDLWYYNYNKYLSSVNPETEEVGPSAQTEYEIGLYPFAEYTFNDTYNFRTVYRGNVYGSGRDSRMSFVQYEPTQSMGLGIAATRDIFLYPNVQWVWRDTRSEKTNVALSATMNFF